MNRNSDYSFEDADIHVVRTNRESGLYNVESGEDSLKNKDEEDHLKSRQLTRVTGERCDNDKLAKIKELQNSLQEEKVGNIRQILWTLTQKVFVIFCPETLKTHLSNRLLCAIGVLIFALLVGAFVFFYKWQNVCQEVMLETSNSDPDDAIFCITNYIAHTHNLGIDVNGYWSTDIKYNKIFGGPWEVRFSQYKADWKTLSTKISQLMGYSSQFISTQENVEFFRFLEQAYFYFERVTGDNQSEIQFVPDIDLPTVFNNYVITGFGLVNLAQPIKQNFEENHHASVNSSWWLLKSEACQESENFLSSISNQNWECGYFFSNSAPNSQHQKAGTHVRTISSTFYQELVGYLYPGSTFEESYIGNKSFSIKWSFPQMFAYSYCNGQGSAVCHDLLLNNSTTLQDKQDWPYISAPDFMNILNLNRTFVPDGDHEDDSLQKTVYINSTKQFGLYIGHDFIYRPRNSNASVEEVQYLNKKGVTVEYVLVPQLSLATPQLSEATYQGTTYYVCESCEERQRYLNATNQKESENSFTGKCMQSAYIYLHLYVVPFKPQFTSTGLSSPSDGLHFLDNYFTTMLYRLDGKNPSFSYFTQNYSSQQLKDPFMYNSQLAQIQDLHCNAREWGFNTDHPSSEEPFTLTTGVYSCMIRHCPTIFDLLGTAQANTQLFHFALQLSIITLYVCFVIPMISARRTQEKENWTKQIYESVEELTETVAETFR